MGKNYVDDKDMERKDEKEIMDNYEKRRTGYNNDGSPLRMIMSSNSLETRLWKIYESFRVKMGTRPF